MGNYTESALDVFISRLAQVNYLTRVSPFAADGTTIPNPKNFIQERLKQPAMPKVSTSKTDNAGYTGNQGFPDEVYADKWTSSFGYSLDLKSGNIGRYLYAALGAVQSSALIANTVYKHIFKPINRNVSVEMPAYTLGSQLSPGGGGLNVLNPSMTCDSLGLAASGTGKIEAQVAWTGSGEEITPSNVTTATQVSPFANVNTFFNSQSNIIVTDAATDTSTFSLCEDLGWNFNVKNTYADDSYGCVRFKSGSDPTSGVVRSQRLLTGQAMDLDYIIKMRTNNPEFAALIDQRPLGIETKLTGAVISGAYSHSLRIIANLVKYNSVERAFTNGFATVAVKPDLLWNAATSEIVSIELINNVASYTV